MNNPNEKDLKAEWIHCTPCHGTGYNGELAAPDSPHDAPCYRCGGTGKVLKVILFSQINAPTQIS